jgi:ketosteroid isomerase-like protein
MKRGSIMTQVTTNHVESEELAATNRELAKQVITLLGSEKQFDLYADDIVVEFPYASSLDMPGRFEGKDAVVAYVRELNVALKGLTMRDMVYYSVDGQPDTVFIEYFADAPTPGGNTYLQTYINKMKFRDGKMVYMREYWDPKKILDARAGLYDLK